MYTTQYKKQDPAYGLPRGCSLSTMIKQYFWLLPFFCFLAGFLLFRFIFHPSPLPTPALVGKDIYQAARILSDHKLNMRILKEQENHDLPQGTILNQTPSSGQKIRPHQSVFLVVSQKPESALVPLCVGKSLPMIEKEITSMGLSIKPYYIAHSYPAGLCFAQIPSANSTLSHKPIIIYISAGSVKPILWPDFRKKTVQETQEFLLHYDIHPLYVYKNIPLEFEDIPATAYINDQRPLSGCIFMLDPQHPLKPQFQIEI